MEMDRQRTLRRAARPGTGRDSGCGLPPAPDLGMLGYDGRPSTIRHVRGDQAGRAPLHRAEHGTTAGIGIGGGIGINRS